MFCEIKCQLNVYWVQTFKSSYILDYVMKLKWRVITLHEKLLRCKEVFLLWTRSFGLKYFFYFLFTYLLILLCDCFSLKLTKHREKSWEHVDNEMWFDEETLVNDYVIWDARSCKLRFNSTENVWFLLLSLKMLMVIFLIRERW